MKLFENKTLYTFVAALVSLSLVAYSFGFYSVQASEVSTLPAAIDITVDYDSDNVNWTYSDKGYTFSRNTPLAVDVDGKTMYFNSVYTEYSSSAYFRVTDYKTSDFFVPTVESFNGIRYNASYWFSPSENSVYVLRTQGSGAEIEKNKGFIRSYSSASGHGSFSFWTQGASTWYHLYVYRYDFNTHAMTICDFTINVSRSTTLSEASYVWYFNFDNGFTLSSSSDLFDVYACNDNTRYQIFFPSDLLCLFSTYEISGFYQIDSSKVVTPDYYMQYQYIFYRDDKGYTFIDSGLPLTEVTAQGSYAYLTFDDSCNKYIYTSVDGIDWTIQTTISTMYGGTYTNLSYDWFYSNVTVGFVNQYDAQLIYTNDDLFGVGRFDWKDIHSAISDITLISTDGQDITDIVEQSGYDEFFNAFSASSEFSAFDIFNQWGFVSSGTQTILKEKYNELLWSFYRSLYHQLSNEHRFSYVWDDNEKVLRQEKRITLFGLLQNTYFETYNIRSLLETFGNDFMSSVSILNNNLSGLYELDSKLLLAVKDIKIPDYSNSLSDISAKLDKLSFGSGSGSGSLPPLLSFDDSEILGRLDTANGLLTDIKDLGTPDLQTVIKPIKNGFDDIHGDLKYIKTLLTVNTIDNLFDDDDNDDKKGVGTFVTTGISSLASGSVISGALAFTPGVVSAIQGINSIVSRLYTSVPALIPVFTLGPSFYIIDLILRRKK